MLRIMLVALALTAVARADDAAYWRARVSASIQLHAEQNPWYPPVPAGKPNAPATLKTIVDQRPIVYRLHATWCGPCKDVEALLTKAVRDKLPFQIVDWDVDKQGYMGATQIPGFWWKSPRGNLRCNWSNLETLVATWKATQTPIKAGSEIDALSPELRAMYEQAKTAGYTDSQIRSYAVRRGWIR